MKIIKSAVLFLATALALAQPIKAAVIFAVTPSAVSNTYVGAITLQIGGLAKGDTVVVQKLLDLNQNGLIDAGDLLVQQFNLTDGKPGMAYGGVTNFNVPYDTDNTSNSQITAVVNFQNGELANIMGNYFYKLTSPFGHFAPITNQFAVTNFSFGQKFTGSVLKLGTSTAVPNALVVLFPAGAHAPALTATVANNAGQYTLLAPPGTYSLVALASNSPAFTKSAAPVVTLGAGTTLVTNLVVTNAMSTISGSLVDASTGLGLPGMMLKAKSTSGIQLLALAFTDTNGLFSVPVTAGQWSIGFDQLSLLGYVAPGNSTTTNAGATGVSNSASQASALIYGCVTNTFGNPMPALDVDAQDDNGNYGPYCLTDANGNYVLGVMGLGSNDPWNVEANDDGQITNYDFSTQTISGIINSQQAVLQNFTAILATNYITGSLRDQFGNPIVGASIYEGAYLNGLDYTCFSNFGVDTDTNGNYTLNVCNGKWTLGVEYLPGNYTEATPANPSVTILNNNEVVNFTATLTSSGYTFGPQVQSESTANITYNFGAGMFQFASAVGSQSYAYLPLTGSPASIVTTANGWTASLAVDLAPTTLIINGSEAPSVSMALAVFDNSFVQNRIVCNLLQVNNTAGNDISDFANGFYGTSAQFAALTSGNEQLTTALGSSQTGQEGDSYLVLSGGGRRITHNRIS